jgi:putative Holliday junction resolvase
MESSVTLTEVRVLGIDYGRRRIGLALSDATGLLARPWKTVLHPGTLSDAAALLAAEILQLQREDDGLGAIVLGFPRRLSGEASEQTQAVTKLYGMLQERAGVPIVLQDERLSSHEAEMAMAPRVKDWRKRKALLDAAAAAVILQDFLDSARPPAPGPEADDEKENEQA